MGFIKKIWNKIKFLLKYLGNGKKTEYNTDIKNNTGDFKIYNGEINIVNGEQIQQ